MTRRLRYKHKFSSSLKLNLWGRQKIKVKRLKKKNALQESRPSEFGRMLFAKQLLHGFYGNITEKQLYNLYNQNKLKLVSVLERRLDIILFRMKFASSIFQARQLINHKHVLVNGSVVNISNYLLCPGDLIEIKKDSKEIVYINVLKRIFENILFLPKPLEIKSIFSNNLLFKGKMFFFNNKYNNNLKKKKHLFLKFFINKIFCQKKFISIYYTPTELFLSKNLIHACVKPFPIFANFIKKNLVFDKVLFIKSVLEKNPFFFLPNYLEVNYKTLKGIYLYIPKNIDVVYYNKINLEEIKNYYNR